MAHDHKALGYIVELRTHVRRVEAGSDLTKDDACLPARASASHTVNVALDSAIAHFDLAAATYFARKEGESPALFTLARAGLLAAARAVWLLAPSDGAERQLRVLWVNWLECLSWRQAITDSAREHLVDDALGEIQEAASRLHGRTLVWNKRPKDTQMIQSAGDTFVKWQPEFAAVAESVIMQWRLTSGIAHGMSWSLLFAREWPEAPTYTEQLGEACFMVGRCVDLGFLLYLHRAGFAHLVPPGGPPLPGISPT